jgi:hypothetical protein
MNQLCILKGNGAVCEVRSVERVYIQVPYGAPETHVCHVYTYGERTRDRELPLPRSTAP